MFEVKNSVGKHEGDIPKFKVADGLADFFVQRQSIMPTLPRVSQLSGQTFENDEYAVLPKLSNIFDAEDLPLLESAQSNYIFALEKKFVLFGELSTHYSTDIKPLNKDTDCTDVYVSLAAVLLRYFFEMHDFNGLNSAIRLLDKVSSLTRKGMAVSNIEILKYVLDEEKRALLEVSNG